MSIDPVIAYHEVDPHRFELSCIRTRSIRDQIVRAELLVERLILRGDLAAAGGDLLVLGGGAAGVSAALAACTKGIKVTLVEKEPTPLTRQIGIKTRRLHPSEYDWPHEHWRQPSIGTLGSFALDYPPATAEGLAIAWRKTLDDIITGVKPVSGVLDLYVNLDASKPAELKINLNGKMLDATSPHWASPKHFGAAISCVGFSGEKTTIPSTTGGEIIGPEFWHLDTLDATDLGLGATPTGGFHEAVISGAGDGAQQDFARVLTGKFGIELADALGLPKDPHNLPEIARAVLAEDMALRALSAAEPGQRLPAALAQWHDAYERVVEAIWKSWSGSSIAKHTGLLKPNVRATWVLGGPHLDYSFALNRVLSLLVARLHARATKRPFSATGAQLVAGQNMDAVIVLDARASGATPPTGVTHTCGAGCYGLPHTLELMAFPAGGTAAQVPLGPFHVIVPRHGVHQTPLFGHPPVHEQRVPFFRPA